MFQDNQRNNSKASLKSSQHSLLSHTSSLTSPVLRRLSQREGSLVSVDSTATYISAREDAASDSISNWSHTRLASDSSLAYDQTDNTVIFEEGETSMNSEPLWFAVDRDSTMDTVVAKSVAKQMAASGDQSSSSSSESIASFVSAVSSQSVTTKTDSKKIEKIPFVRQSSEGGVLYERIASAPVIEQERHTSEENVSYSETHIKHIPSSGSNLVDLHGQMNQPITKSHLLMSCYATHMTKLRCSHWSAQGPQSHGGSPDKPQGPPPPLRAAAGGRSSSSYLARQTSLSSDPTQSLSWIPQFEYTDEGFTPSLMVNKR